MTSINSLRGIGRSSRRHRVYHEMSTRKSQAVMVIFGVALVAFVFFLHDAGGLKNLQESLSDMDTSVPGDKTSIDESELASNIKLQKSSKKKPQSSQKNSKPSKEPKKKKSVPKSNAKQAKESEKWHPATSEGKQSVRVVLCREDVKIWGDNYTYLLPHLFPFDSYDVQTMETDHGVVPQELRKDFKPDVLLCLGFFYPKNYTSYRRTVGKKYGRVQYPSELTKQNQNPDILLPEEIDLVPHRAGRPFQVSFSYEAWDGGDCRYDVMIIVKKNIDHEGCPLIFWPPYASSFFKRRDPPSLLPKLVRDEEDLGYASRILQNKTKFCAFVVQTCWDDRYSVSEPLVRVIFYDLLSEAYNERNSKKKRTGGKARPEHAISSFGLCRNNEPRDWIEQQDSKESGKDILDTISEIYKPFKFALVFENTALTPGYVSEKITNALLAESMPIYWGAPDIADYVNLDRFVHCNFEGEGLKQFRDLPLPRDLEEAEKIISGKGRELLKESMQPCIDEVLELDSDKEKYIWKLSQPILPNNEIKGSYFDLERIASSIREVMKIYESPLVS